MERADAGHAIERFWLGAQHQIVSNAERRACLRVKTHCDGVDLASVERLLGSGKNSELETSRTALAKPRVLILP